MASFSENLKTLITFRGLLHKEVAARAGIKKRALDMYLGRQHSLPPVDVAVRLARALGVSVEYLVGDEGIPGENGENDLYKEEKTGVSPKKPLIEEIVGLRKEDRDVLLSLVRHIEKLRREGDGNHEPHKPHERGRELTTKTTNRENEFRVKG